MIYMGKIFPRTTLVSVWRVCIDMRKVLYIGGAIILVSIAGYFIAQVLIRKKVQEALRILPASIKLTYSSLRTDIPGRSLVIDDVRLMASGRQVSIGRLMVSGIDYLALARSRKNVLLGGLKFSGVRVEEPGKFFVEGDVEIDSVHVADLDKPEDSVRAGAVRLHADKLSYVIPQAYETMHLSNLHLDSKRGSLHADTVRIIPTVARKELGGIKGHQVDWMTAACEGLSVEGLDVMALLQHRLIADEINIRRSKIYVFRDRRLPLEEGSKPLPVDYLKSLPLSIRVRSVKLGSGAFTYEEFPRTGDKTGVLNIVHLSVTVKPLINHPAAGDPAHITVVTEGSLMGSGSVRATTKMPLHKGDPYMVEGAFHELDVTSLNPAAENLGDIHLESGMLNSLAFRFAMTPERATGKIVGEYHNLVADKLRGRDEKKVDKIKSFFLKKLIIPKNKDHTLPEPKRTGKVDYKRDPERYFSYYMLHALLVGVKSSFALGFLLPG